MSGQSVAQRLGLDRIGFVGRDLNRPECVVAGSDGTLCVSDWRGGITAIQPDGGQTLIAPPAPVDGITLKPNGFDRLADGSFLIAHLDETVGGVFHMAPDGVTRPHLTTIDGRDLPPTNFVLRDAWGRTWITVSTWHVPRHPVRLPGRGDGFIVLVDERGARIVADGLSFTNELRLDADGRHIYVIETFGRRLTRFRLTATSALVDRTTITDFGPGNFPDGLAFDRTGHIWVTSVFSNRLLRVRPDGAFDVILEDIDPAYVEEVEADFQSGAFARRPSPTSLPSRVLQNISSIAFGADGSTAYLGCLLGDRIARLRIPWLA